MTSDKAEKILKSAVDFQALSYVAREKCRDQYRKVEKSEENILRIHIDGQIALLANRMGAKIEKITPEISYQVGVASSFIRTHFLAADFFMNGDLVESLLLIRKQLESLARLHELDSKPLQRLEGRVPNIQNVLQGGSGKMYGHLSEAAHFSRPRVAELLHVVENGDLIGPSLLPVFTERSFACLDMNCFVALYFLAWMVQKLPAWYPGYDNTEAQRMVIQGIDLALRCGVIRKGE
ncbi:hypothetical protein KP003_02865 [Geomonas nitrogeniifigens]|uniref:hypothetical protein n=1 Tax=Geomonas diazotrophica TaxID=2843197 RepID=UPI001C2C8702|nr:hypothetical protein [Geomonas nitrogeniifigens]QXE87366.1 hypothetical protein KP003_02865 [Geomonas nitrogeniifigens]